MMEEKEEETNKTKEAASDERRRAQPGERESGKVTVERRLDDVLNERFFVVCDF